MVYFSLNYECYVTLDSDGMEVAEVTYVGCFESDGTIYTYYRIVTDQNDLIVHVENGEKIHFNYEDLNNIYNIQYEITGDTSGTSVDEVFGTDRKEQAVKNSTEVGYTVNIPRGYYATVYRNNTAVGTLGLDSSTSPQGITYSVSNDKVITKTGDLTLSNTYSIPAATSTDQTIRVALTKRNSYTFDASKFLSTVYTGGNSNTMGDDAVNTNANARITGDGSLGRSGTNKGKKTFNASDNGATVSWSFETNTTETSTWLMDALEINGTTIEVPYAADTTGTVGESKTTILPSGTVVTVSLDSMIRATNGRYQRTYTISVSNCFEDIVISGGNIYNSNNSTEIIPEVLDKVSYQFYGYSSSDNAYTYAGNTSYLKWQDWGVGEPIAVGESNGAQSTAQRRNYNMYGYNQGDRQSMRFRIDKGYVDPQIAYVTSTETDLISNVTGLSLGTKTDGYYPITSDPYNDGYYYFKITGMGNNKLALLRIKADLGHYGVKYSAGEMDGTPISLVEGTLPDAIYDEYNVETNPQIVLSSVVPQDSTESYIFQYWTIDGDTSARHYAPGQVIDLLDVCDYAVKDNDGKLVIPLTANWVPKAQAEQISYIVEFWIEDETSASESFDMQAPKGSAIYVNKGSEHISDFIESYDNLLEYDEAGSATYIASVDQGDIVKLRFKWIRYPVTITKSVVSTIEADKTRDFSFNSSLSHKYNPTAPGATAVSLKDGQTKSIKEIINTSEHEIRKASKLTLEETGIDGFDVSYTVTIYKDNGTDVKETKTVSGAELSSLDITGKTDITVTNMRKTVNVAVKKLVEGNMADTSKSFTFNYSIDGTAGTAFNLSNGSEKTIENVPIGSTLVITETDADEYTTTVAAVDGSNTAVSGHYDGENRSYTLTVPQNGGIVTFTNTKTVVAPTQLYSGTGPMAVLVVFSLGALILLAAHHFIDRFRNSNNM